MGSMVASAQGLPKGRGRVKGNRTVMTYSAAVHSGTQRFRALGVHPPKCDSLGRSHTSVSMLSTATSRPNESLFDALVRLSPPYSTSSLPPARGDEGALG